MGSFGTATNSTDTIIFSFFIFWRHLSAFWFWLWQPLFSASCCFAAICQPSGFGWKKKLDEFVYQMISSNT
jgi:hypothetical protein